MRKNTDIPDLTLMWRMLRRRKSAYSSNDQLFRAVEALVAQLRAEGKTDVAEQLARGWGCLNGPSDGWTLFLEAIDSVEGRKPTTLDADQHALLSRIRVAVRSVVSRR